MPQEPMKREGIPDGITREDVELAVQGFSSGTVTHNFHESEKYDLLIGDERFPPKAILGIAARRVAGRVLEPRDFSGGLGSRCFHVLEGLGFKIVPKPGSDGDQTTADGEDWNDKELDAAVAAYLEMLRAESEGRPFNKAETNRQLRAGALSSRRRGSVEYRMANISAVLQGIGRTWVHGYKPAKNVGTAVTAKILSALERLDAAAPDDRQPEGDPQKFEKKVRRILRVPSATPPTGVVSPKRSTRTSEVIARDPEVAAWVRSQAKGICECCGQPAPFLDEGGFPFLEVHHVKPLAKDGPDTIENAVAVCPNCHRQCHHAKDRDEVGERLYVKVGRLKIG
jgi:5-methylcytosine-specific restriction protein A